MTVTREEFHKIYKEQLEPILKPLDEQYINFMENQKRNMNISCLGMLVLILGTIVLPIYLVPAMGEMVIWVILLFYVLVFVCMKLLRKKTEDKEFYRKQLKEKIFSQILLLHGNFYFSQKSDVIPLNYIHTSMGLYNRANSKLDEDIVVGTYKGCNLLINECNLFHTKDHGKTVAVVFNGLIVKIQMKKNFNGKTILAPAEIIKKMNGFESVELESVDFMKNKKVYSTDQVEARYLLTTALMEHLMSVLKVFNTKTINSAHAVENLSDITTTMDRVKKVPVVGRNLAASIDTALNGAICAAFLDSAIYVFIETSVNFFDINVDYSAGDDIKKYTLLDEEKYYNIYNQLSAILGIIDYLKLDKNLGL